MIYLDSHSTTQVDINVVYTMIPYFGIYYGNPSSQHNFGIQAKEAVEKSRQIIAEYINAKPYQIYFTSGASESNNTLIKGLHSKIRQSYSEELTIVTSSLEHPSILESINYLCNKDNKTYERLIPINSKGQLSDFVETIEDHLLKPTLLCSIQAANHEIGSINDLLSIGSICKDNNIFFHTDATQAMGKVYIDVEAQHIDALSFSAHKIGGPKGIGVLYLKNAASIDPLLSGGLQETIRSGTLNVPYIVGLGKAIELLKEVNWKHIEYLRNLLLELILNELPDIIVNGDLENRLPNNLNISIPGIKSEVFTKGMKDIMVSSGSACKSGNDKPSDILLTIGSQHPDCAIRFGLWKNNTEEEICKAAEQIINITKRIRLGDKK